MGKERTVKNGTISSRASIVQRSKGQSAVEQSAYISRTSLYSDYYGMTYNRTAKEECLLGSDKLKAFDTLQSINFKGIYLKKLKK